MFCCACFLPSCVSADEVPPSSVTAATLSYSGLQGPHRWGVACGENATAGLLCGQGWRGEKGFPRRPQGLDHRLFGCCLPAVQTGVHVSCRTHGAFTADGAKKKKVCKRRLTPRAEDFCVGVSRACPALTDLRQPRHTSHVHHP